MSAIRVICVATDGSVCADRAVDWAADLAAQLSAKLVIVTIGTDSSIGGTIELARARESEGDILDTNARRVLAGASGRARKRGVTDIAERILWGDVAGTVLKFLDDEKPDLLVAGRRGIGRLTRLLVGSVSQKIVALATCPVTIVP